MMDRHDMRYLTIESIEKIVDDFLTKRRTKFRYLIDNINGIIKKEALRGHFETMIYLSDISQASNLEELPCSERHMLIYLIERKFKNELKFDFEVKEYFDVKDEYLYTKFIIQWR